MAIMTRDFNSVDLSDPKAAALAVKRKALEMGADVVGIGNIDRWAGAPLQMDPRQIMPECKSIIGMVFRVERGSLRGVEEGTYFSNYSAMGYGGITYLYMPMTVINLSKFIEDQGYEAIPMGHQSDWRAINNEGNLIKNFSRPVRPGQAYPDIMLHLRISAYLCGLGEIGFSKMFLSPQFGPRCRVGMVLTDVELEPDPIYDGPQLCNRCMACIKACPGQCFDPKKPSKSIWPVTKWNGQTSTSKNATTPSVEPNTPAWSRRNLIWKAALPMTLFPANGLPSAANPEIFTTPDRLSAAPGAVPVPV